MDRAFGVGNVVVERQSAGRFEVLVDAIAQPAFDRFAELAPRRPAEPSAENAVAKGVVGKVQVHASRSVRPQCADAFEIGRFLKGERGFGREGFERVVKLDQDGIVRGLVRKRLLHLRLEGRDVAPLLPELHQFRRHALPFETFHPFVLPAYQRSVSLSHCITAPTRFWRSAGAAIGRVAGGVPVFGFTVAGATGDQG